MTVALKSKVVKAVGKFEEQEWKFDIAINEGTEEEQINQIMEVIADFSERLEEMDDDIDPTSIDWVVNDI